MIPPCASSRDWANISEGPAGLIGERVLAADVADYLSFRAVCRPWRLCSTAPREHGVLDRRFHPKQWTVLRAQAGGHGYRRCLVNVATGSCRHVDLPELHGHQVYGPTTEGLLVLLDRATWVIRLLNPMTRQRGDLPPATTLFNQKDLELTWIPNEKLLQVSGAGLAGDSTLAAHFPELDAVAVAKPGDARWTVVVRGGCFFLPAMSFAGRFYCANRMSLLVVVTGAGGRPPRMDIAAHLARPYSRMTGDTAHLVDNGGELLLVDRQCKGSQNPRRYEVHRVDLAAREMVPVRGLGGRAVFIGRELALSVSPSAFPCMMSADAIYLGFDEMMSISHMDHSPAHLMDGTSEPRRLHACDSNMLVYGPRSVDECLSLCVTGYCTSTAEALTTPKTTTTYYKPTPKAQQLVGRLGMGQARVRTCSIFAFILKRVDSWRKQNEIEKFYSAMLKA